MPRQIDQSTLAAIGGQQTADAAKSFADTMMNLYTVKKNAEMQDMQINQMKQQQQEWEANKQLRAKEREVNLQRLDAETQLLPLQTKNAISAEVNKTVELKTQAFDNAMANLATVKGAKSARKWKEENKDLIRERFDSDEQYKAFMEQPYSEDWKHAVLTDHQRWKPEMIQKAIEYNWELNLAKAKTAQADAMKLSVPSPTSIQDVLSDMGVDSDLRPAGSMMVRDLMDLSRNNKIPIPMGSTEALKLVKIWSDEIDDANWGAPDNAAAEFEQKRNQFLMDVQQGMADSYFSRMHGVPVAAIQEVRNLNPDYTDNEIYKKILKKRKAKQNGR